MLADVDGFTVGGTGGSLTLNDFSYPLEDLEITLPDIRQENNPKMQQDGEWAGYQRLSGMDIHIEGNIFGTDSEDYFNKRVALVQILRNAVGADTPFPWNVAILFIGSGTGYWQANISKIDFAAPVGGGSPSRSPFTVTFHSPTPYFIDEDNNPQYYS